jgi:hypothetical protein
MALTHKLQVFEILDKAVKAKNREERIKVLQENNIMPVLDILRGTFDETIRWNIPDGTPPYTPNEESSPPSTLLRQHLNFKYFVQGLRESNSLNKIKREKKFIDLLESVHPRDAELVISMINKKSPHRYITKKLVQEAFPSLIRE